MFIEFIVPKLTTFMKTGRGHVKKQNQSLIMVIIFMTIISFLGLIQNSGPIAHS